MVVCRVCRAMMARNGADRNSLRACDSASARREVGGTVTKGAKCAREGQLTWRLRKRRHTKEERQAAETLRLEREPLVCRIATGPSRRRVAIAAATRSSAAAVSNETESVGSEARLTGPTETVSASKP